jgi:VWFA-related protein
VVTILHGRPLRSLTRTVWLVMLGGMLSTFGLPIADTQAQSATAPAPQAPRADASQNAPKPDAQASNDEIVLRDSPATFKVRANLVLVRVVVRDDNGKAVPNLTKDDFQLTDEHKPQVISSFSVETPASQIPSVRVDSAQATSEATPTVAPVLPPQRFVTLFFDDFHLAMEDLVFSRRAATKLFAAMGTGDRLSIFTTSGLIQQDFTADREKLNEALQRIVPHRLVQSASTDCPPMTFYEAYLIMDLRDQAALAVAVHDVESCIPGVVTRKDDTTTAQMIAEGAAQRVLSMGEAEIQSSFSNLEALIRRMSVLPGQRIIVIMSPGFFVNPAMRESGDIIDRATKASVVINTIDARGLYVSSVFDVSGAVPSHFASTEELLQNDILAELADGTGGLFFHNRNDIDQGLLQAAADPEVCYVLGFAPQNLKLDGKYHHLRVSLVNKPKWNLQARHGYFAPHGQADPEALAKEEIEQAIFYQEELRDLRIDCQTQFFRDTDRAHLSVATRLETHGLKFRRVDGRNDDVLMFAAAIFNGDGGLVTGEQKTLSLKLKDATLDRVNRAGVGVKFSFELLPGTYLVRVVVRDSEGAQMATINRGVVIP